ncbi:nuclear transport factor 2 family protein [Rhizohabitans arisaemae]|uniref:nuclear transport factor 2 family protein n=1 Tax=Rhizohabitans arisaemae TaxID=2720610 RepID=UPI0024B095F7|nr:nuclear transport factor 2 family protein [Rhizohabitans arisaemae]
MSIETELIELSEKSWEANRNGDAAFFDRFLTETPLSVSHWGVVSDRDAILRGFAENRNPYLRTDQSDHRVTVLTDESAVHTSTVEIDVLVNGTDKQTVRLFASSVLVKRDGEWKCALFQVSPAPTT